MPVQLQLWNALLAAAVNNATKSQDQALETVQGIQTRISRLLEQPPAGFPAGPSGEQSLELLADPIKYITRVTSTWGEAAGLVLGGEYVVLVSSPRYAKQVLVEQPDVFVKAGTAFFPGSSLTGNGLLVSDGDVWRRQRQLANPAFRKAAVQLYSSCMVSATQQMLDGSLREGGSRDVYSDFNSLTLQITMEALFGFESTGPESELVVSNIERAFEFFTQRAASGLLLPEWLPTWDNLQFGAAVQRLDRVVFSIIQQRRQQLSQAEEEESDSTAPRDLLQGLLTARDEAGTGMGDVALRDELMTLLVAGQETSAILLAWAAALLAHHPEQQERVAAEVDSVLGGRTPTPQDAPRLPQLESAVLEALRLYPPAYMVGRCTSRPVALGPHQLPQGTTVLVTPYALHHNPSLWHQPDTFLPSRWAQIYGGSYAGWPAALKDLGPNGAYIPFGGGQRVCIGTGFAMMEVVLVLAIVLQKYRLRPAGAFPAPQPLITLRPGPFRLRLDKRAGGTAAAATATATMPVEMAEAAPVAPAPAPATTPPPPPPPPATVAAAAPTPAAPAPAAAPPPPPPPPATVAAAAAAAPPPPPPPAATVAAAPAPAPAAATVSAAAPAASAPVAGVAPASTALGEAAPAATEAAATAGSVTAAAGSMSALTANDRSGEGSSGH